MFSKIDGMSIPKFPITGKYLLEKGIRLVQICSPDLSPFIVKFVDVLDETERGVGGFGSTGI